MSEDNQEQNTATLRETQTQIREIEADQLLSNLLARIENLEEHNKKLEAQNRKIINLLTKGDIEKRAEFEERENALLKELANAGKGVTTSTVAKLLKVSERAALNRMKKLSKEYEWVIYVKGSGREESKLYHKRNTLNNRIKK